LKAEWHQMSTRINLHFINSARKVKIRILIKKFRIATHMPRMYLKIRP
jgi:hypothetical protein